MSICYISPDNTNVLVSTANQIESMTIQMTCMMDVDRIVLSGVDHDHNTFIMIKIPCKTNISEGKQHILTTTSTELSACFNTYLEGMDIYEVSNIGWKLSNNKVLQGSPDMHEYIRKDMGLCKKETTRNESMRVCTKKLLSCILYTSLCESLVTITRDSDGRLSFDTCGELLAMQIQLNDCIYKNTGAVSCTCVFKYIRSLLPSLQKYETVNINIVNEKFVNVFTDDSTLNILFFHHTQHISKKRKFIETL